MFELGSDEIWLHEGVGKYAVKKEVDVIVCIGKLGKSIYDGAKSEESKMADSFLIDLENKLAGEEFGKEIRTPIQYFESKEEFYKHENDVLRRGDAVLVKASHGMHFEELMEHLKMWKPVSE